MPSKQGYLSQQTFNDAYGVVVGLYGDPKNQQDDDTNHGTDRTEAFQLIDWSHSADNDGLLPSLFWSRLLVVEILVPFGNLNHSRATRLALVARPRSLWLYYKAANVIADFVGNNCDPAILGTASDTSSIADVNPPYRYGDVIRLGTLPAPINMVDFGDNFQRNQQETYNGTDERLYLVDGAGGFNSVALLGTDYDPTIYSSFPVTEILYYDKNVDARTRIVGGGTDTSGTVTVPVCVGGITATYQLHGKRIA